MDKLSIAIGTRELTVTVMGLDEQTNEPAVPIEVEDQNDHEAIKAEISRVLVDRNWCLNPDFAELEPSECFKVKLMEHSVVEVYNFLPRALQREQRNSLALALRSLYQAMHDRRFWGLRSIQIMPTDRPNNKNGEYKLGSEVPREGRFMLFPACFTEGAFHGLTQCSKLVGTCLHEAVHVCLEQPLQKLWDDHDAELGWVSATPDVAVMCPGGARQWWVQLYPEQCPTEYATLQQDDDRADSVVAALVGAPLVEARKRLIEQLLDLDAAKRGSSRPGWRYIESAETRMPDIDCPRFQLVPPKPSNFRVTGKVKPGIELRKLTPEEFRAEYFAKKTA